MLRDLRSDTTEHGRSVRGCRLNGLKGRATTPTPMLPIARTSSLSASLSNVRVAISPGWRSRICLPTVLGLSPSSGRHCFWLCAAPARIAILFTQVKLGVFSELRSVCSRLSPWCRVFGQRVGANTTREGKQSVPSGSRNALFAFLGSSQTLASSVADAESCRSIICGLY